MAPPKKKGGTPPQPMSKGNKTNQPVFEDEDNLGDDGDFEYDDDEDEYDDDEDDFDDDDED